MSCCSLFDQSTQGQSVPGPEYGPTHAEWLTSLPASGLRIVQYSPLHVCGMGRNESAPNCRGTTSCTRDGRLYVRISPAACPRRDLPDAAIQVDVMLYRGTDVPAPCSRLRPSAGKALDRRWSTPPSSSSNFHCLGRATEISYIPSISSNQCPAMVRLSQQ